MTIQQAKAGPKKIEKDDAGPMKIVNDEAEPMNTGTPEKKKKIDELPDAGPPKTFGPANIEEDAPGPSNIEKIAEAGSSKIEKTDLPKILKMGSMPPPTPPPKAVAFCIYT